MIRKNGKGISDKFAQQALRMNISLIEDRLSKIEEKVFKLKRTPTNLSQQMLLLHELGILKEFKKLNLSDLKLAQLLSVILNADKDNIRKSLSTINTKDSKLKTSINYAFALQTFEDLGLEDLTTKVNNEYNKLKDQEDKNNYNS